jgi:hypothetical protein
MLWAVWFGLAFLLVVLAVGIWHVVREGLALWRTLSGFSALLGRASDAVGSRADEASRKAAAAGDAAVRLTAANERLARSLAYASVIAGAAGGTQAAFYRARRSLPHK